MPGILAGGFIELGAFCYVLVISDPTLGFATARVLGGACFSLLVIAWTDGKRSTSIDLNHIAHS